MAENYRDDMNIELYKLLSLYRVLPVWHLMSESHCVMKRGKSHCTDIARLATPFLQSVTGGTHTQ